MAEGDLTTKEMRGMLEGWGPRAMTMAHDVVENVGGGLAGAISAKWGTGPAYALGFALQIANGIAGPSHPWIGMGTALGSGLVAGANAVKVYQWMAFTGATPGAAEVPS